MKFANFIDTKGIFKDIMGVGGWSNVDVGVGLHCLDRLGDVMAIIQ